MCIFPKKDTSIATYLHEFDHLLQDKYVNYTKLFTDCRWSWISSSLWGSYALPKPASIFSVELHSIHLALVIICDYQEHKFVIFTDLRSLIQAIQNGYTSNSVCRRLQHEMHDVLLTNTIELCWILSHVGVLWNEEADLSAKPLNKYKFRSLTAILY